MTARARLLIVLCAVALLAVAAAPAPARMAAGTGTGTSVDRRVLRLVDDSRRAHFRNGASAPRVLVTDVRYPAQGQAPFPLLVFGHGFGLSPVVYTRLLDTWARAGYVVAAPAFPVERTDAPGGPDESDLVNEPGDISFVITRLTARAGPLNGLVDPTRIAVAGHSDGAVAALAAAYDRRFRDPRIDAAIVLSGAALPGFVSAPSGSPPLLAVQGTRDPINPPGVTARYFRRMRRPKFLLWLLGAGHLPPYTTASRWVSVVEAATTSFLDHYLQHAPLRSLLVAGTKPGTARISSSG